MDVLEAIGNTSLVRLRKVVPQSGEQVAALIAAALATPEHSVREAQRAGTPN
jgi:hypothetical protein